MCPCGVECTPEGRGVPVHRCGGGGDPNLDNSLTTPELPQPLCLVETETFALRDLEFDSSTLIKASWICHIMLTDFISRVQIIHIVRVPCVFKPMYDFYAGPVQSVSSHKYFSFHEQRFECNYIKVWMGKALLMKVNYLWSHSFYIAV